MKSENDESVRKNLLRPTSKSPQNLILFTSQLLDQIVVNQQKSYLKNPLDSITLINLCSSEDISNIQ